MFEAVGADCVVTMDVHNLAAFQNAFRCRTEHLEAAKLFVAHLAPLVGTADAVVVSPDAGGIKRAERLRTLLAVALGRPVGAAFAEKYRSGGVVSGEALVGDVAGKVAIIVDDLISAGNTIARAAVACRNNGAARVWAAATHGIFALAANDVLARAPLDGLAGDGHDRVREHHRPGLRSRLVTLGSAGLSPRPSRGCTPAGRWSSSSTADRETTGGC
jgi:ribose-phosphate pyrophosphokinase